MLINYLKKVNKPIVLYGMGNGADKVLNLLGDNGIKVSGVFASDDFARENDFRGFKVVNYTKMKEKFPEMIVLVCFGTQRPEIIERILNISSEQELYAPDTPVYGDNIFNLEFKDKHFDELHRVYNMLADDVSKNVFSSIVKFKLNGDIKNLIDCQTDIDEAYNNVLKLNDNEIYVDFGAYNGDTVHEFINHVGGYRHIYAVEPDLKNFKKLEKNCVDINNLTALNVGVSDMTREGYFEMNSGRNSFVSESGKQSVRLSCVDEILNGVDVTYMKFDVEGEEEKALLGAKETILRCKPKMLVSAYHRSEDIFKLPLLVNGIRNDYKIYMRHYPYIPAWDTNFYFV